MTDAVPVKQRSITAGPSPMASKICAPAYDCSVEIPIFERILSSPFSAALRYFPAEDSTSRRHCNASQGCTASAPYPKSAAR